MATPYILVVGSKATDYPSKAAAQKAGRALRAKGVANAFTYSKADAAKFGLDPRSKAPVPPKSGTMVSRPRASQKAASTAKTGAGG